MKLKCPLFEVSCLALSIVRSRIIFTVAAIAFLLMIVLIELEVGIHVTFGMSLVEKGHAQIRTNANSISNEPRVIMPVQHPYDPRLTNPRNMTGSWIGDSWIPPPGWRYFLPDQLIALYKDVKMIWIGDSIARRTGLTLWSLLTSSTLHVSTSALSLPSVIDAAKLDGEYECSLWSHSRYRPKICRRIANGKGMLWHIRLNCLSEIEGFFRNELSADSKLTEDFHLIIIAAGLWDVEITSICGQPDRTTNQVQANLIQTLDHFQQINRNKLILFRTSGYGEDADKSLEKTMNMTNFLMDEIDRYTNQYAMQGVRNNITYINWGGAVEPRSFGYDRIKGDNKAHYGAEPRIVMIQQMTNLLNDRGFFDDYHRL